MGYMESYREWLENPYFDEETKAELKAIQNDEKEIREYKATDLKFRPRRKKKNPKKDGDSKENGK